MQCVHDMVLDGDFVLEKWSTRFWNDKKCRSDSGTGTHLRDASEYAQVEIGDATSDDNLPWEADLDSPNVEATSPKFQEGHLEWTTSSLSQNVR